MVKKYRNFFHYTAAQIVRARTRSRLAGLVKWPAQYDLEDGCTAIIGVHRNMPDVMVANFALLSENASATLSGIIACVDGPKGCVPEADIERARLAAAPLTLEVLYYTQEQSAKAEALLLPYVYSWLSWSICLQKVTTKHVLFHDFDALILDDHLARRYTTFCKDDAFIQGISWYQVNGFQPEDRLATTFEAFVDAGELLSHDPRDMFNQVGTYNGKRVDFDTLLAIQARHIPPDRRTSVPTTLDMLVHPSQMIHQYTMFRRQPGAALPCYSVIMLPFYSYLGGAQGALEFAAKAVRNMSDQTVKLESQGVLINLETLKPDSLHWAVKQMVQVLWRTNRSIPDGFADYIIALYAHLKMPPQSMLESDLEPAQYEFTTKILGQSGEVSAK